MCLSAGEPCSQVSFHQGYYFSIFPNLFSRILLLYLTNCNLGSSGGYYGQVGKYAIRSHSDPRPCDRSTALFSNQNEERSHVKPDPAPPASSSSQVQLSPFAQVPMPTLPHDSSSYRANDHVQSSLSRVSSKLTSNARSTPHGIRSLAASFHM